MQHLGQLIERIARWIEAPYYDASNATMHRGNPRVAFHYCTLLGHHHYSGLINLPEV
jgi:hypothetical protein